MGELKTSGFIEWHIGGCSSRVHAIPGNIDVQSALLTLDIDESDIGELHNHAGSIKGLDDIDLGSRGRTLIGGREDPNHE